jgi:MFS family permease
MLQAFIHRILLRRHFWRHATFSEVAELYASRTMRIFALRMVSVFTSIYLYQNGYDLLFIAFFWAGFYLLKVPFSIPAAKIAARYGPKHGTLVSNIVSALGMVLLPFVTGNEYGIYPLVGWCILQAFSGSLNDLCYLIDFSKVKNIEHAGKEIGYMNIFEKVATGLSPLIGGGLAFLAGPELVMVVSAVLFLLSAVPLLKTAEPTETHRVLNFSGFPWKTTWRSMVAESAVGFDVFSTGIAWTLFMAVVVFNGNNNAVYAQVGFVTSVTMFVALLASYTYGRLIDHRRGGELLRVSALANSVIHAARPMVTTPIGVVLVNIINEAATTGYSMPFTRGMFDTADMSGKRIEYLFIIEMVVNFGAAIGAIILGFLFWFFDQTNSPSDQTNALNLFFFIAAIATLLIAAPKFVLYRR